MSEQLTVSLNHELLGTLTLHGRDDLYELQYAASWLQRPGFTISPHLHAEDCQSEVVKRFLSNLLPEGKWLEELSRDHRISKGNIFGLIAALGGETTGALMFQFLEDLPTRQSSTFRLVNFEELQDRIRRRQEISIGRWDDRPRLSVAGVQDKLPVFIRENGEMGFGEGELASTHILKFGKKPDMHLVVNEYLCMKLAQLIKLPAARVSLQRFGEPVLVVERFDRKRIGNRVDRLHLIDGCQMLDLPPTYKYERPFGKSGEGAKIRTGASLAQLFAACSLCRIPAAASRDLLHWLLFQLLIGNNDAHAKNISFFVGPKGIDIAPAYDLLNVAFYGDEYGQDLAMAVGDSFCAEKIFSYQLAEMCEDCKLPQRQVATSLKTLCLAVLKNVQNLLSDSALNEAEKEFARKLIEKIRTNATRFLEIAEELPAVKV